MSANRRRFLAALTALAAAPAAAATTPARRPKGHDPSAGRACNCMGCRERREKAARGEDNLLLARTVLSLTALETALDRLTREHCAEGVKGCDACGDADGLLYVVHFGLDMLNGDLLWPGDWYDAAEEAARKSSPRPAPLACALALYDGLDALLDFVEGHCPHWDCWACWSADNLVHHVSTGIDLIAGPLTNPTAPVLGRALLSAERKVARLEAAGGLMPHTRREHCGAEDDAEHYRRVLAVVRDRAAE